MPIQNKISHRRNGVGPQIDVLTGAVKSYSELLHEWVRAAAGWRSLGIGVGDTVAIFSRNNPHTYTALVGAVMEGITLATIVPSANAGACTCSK